MILMILILKITFRMILIWNRLQYYGFDFDFKWLLSNDFDFDFKFFSEMILPNTA